jgi:hypothetical protein
VETNWPRRPPNWRFEYASTYAVPGPRRDHEVMEATVAVADRGGDSGEASEDDPGPLDVAELNRQRVRFDGYFSGPTW